MSMTASQLLWNMSKIKLNCGLWIKSLLTALVISSPGGITSYSVSSKKMNMKNSAGSLQFNWMLRNWLLLWHVFGLPLAAATQTARDIESTTATIQRCVDDDGYNSLPRDIQWHFIKLLPSHWGCGVEVAIYGVNVNLICQSVSSDSRVKGFTAECYK